MISLIVYSTDNKRFSKFKNHTNNSMVNIVRIKNATCVSEAYQSVKNHEKELKNSDKLIFVHDDVFFVDNILKLETAIDQLFVIPETIIGLAGSKCYDARVNPCWWQNENREHSLVGIVDHSEVVSGIKRKWTSKFGNYDKTVYGNKIELAYSEVAVVDGLFLMMPKEYAFDNNPFDSSLDNHFYDIRASLESKLVYAMDFRCEHTGLGTSMNSHGYRTEAKRLILDYQIGKYPR